MKIGAKPKELGYTVEEGAQSFQFENPIPGPKEIILFYSGGACPV